MKKWKITLKVWAKKLILLIGRKFISSRRLMRISKKWKVDPNLAWKGPRFRFGKKIKILRWSWNLSRARQCILGIRKYGKDMPYFYLKSPNLPSSKPFYNGNKSVQTSKTITFLKIRKVWCQITWKFSKSTRLRSCLSRIKWRLNNMIKINGLGVNIQKQ